LRNVNVFADTFSENGNVVALVANTTKKTKLFTTSVQANLTAFTIET